MLDIHIPDNKRCDAPDANGPSYAFQQRRSFTQSVIGMHRFPCTVHCQEPLVSLSYNHRPVSDPPTAPIVDDSVQPCQCTRCGTDEFLVPDNVEARVLPSPVSRPGWDVSYWCSNCDGFFGHLADHLPASWRPETT